MLVYLICQCLDSEVQGFELSGFDRMNYSNLDQDNDHCTQVK